MFRAKIRKIIKKIQLKMNSFTAVKYCCILHGRVCVMYTSYLFSVHSRFLFTTGSDGMVTMVHHHPEDEYEILSLKKVLTSTLSAKVSVSYLYVIYIHLQLLSSQSIKCIFGRSYAVCSQSRRSSNSVLHNDSRSGITYKNSIFSGVRLNSQMAWQVLIEVNSTPTCT